VGCHHLSIPKFVISRLVKLKIKTITKGIKKNRVTTIRLGERKAYGNKQLFNLEKNDFVSGKLERELVSLSSWKLLLI
jgi:hypothetical protein